MTEAGRSELDSAPWAARSLVRAGSNGHTAQPVHDLVIVKHHDVRVALFAAQACIVRAAALSRIAP